jgi:hypothetical protein
VPAPDDEKTENCQEAQTTIDHHAIHVLSLVRRGQLASISLSPLARDRLIVCIATIARESTSEHSAGAPPELTTAIGACRSDGGRSSRKFVQSSRGRLWSNHGHSEGVLSSYERYDTWACLWRIVISTVRRPECNNALHCIENVPAYQFARDTLMYYPSP